MPDRLDEKRARAKLAVSALRKVRINISLAAAGGSAAHGGEEKVAALERGGLAIHEAIDGWRVTHVASGLCVCHVKGAREAALRALDALLGLNLPWDFGRDLEGESFKRHVGPVNKLLEELREQGVVWRHI